MSSKKTNKQKLYTKTKWSLKDEFLLTNRRGWQSCSEVHLVMIQFCKFQIDLQRFHFHECPDHNLTYSLNLPINVSRFISVGSTFHIFGPKIFKLLSPYLAVLWLLTSKSCGRTRAFCLLVNIFLIKSRFKLLAVLYIYVTNCFILWFAW